MTYTVCDIYLVSNNEVISLVCVGDINHISNMVANSGKFVNFFGCYEFYAVYHPDSKNTKISYSIKRDISIRFDEISRISYKQYNDVVLVDKYASAS